VTEPASLFDVHTDRHGDRAVVVVAGELDMSGSPLLEAEVRRAEATDARRIVIDLSAVTFMDSSGLKSLLQAHARSQADSNRLRLVRPPRRVQRVFQLTNTEDILPFLD
jgi:anti-anti-sigma factor